MDGALVKLYWQGNNKLNAHGNVSLSASLLSTEHIWTGPGSTPGISGETPATNLPSYGPVTHVEPRFVRLFACLCSKRTPTSKETFKSLLRIFSSNYCSLKRQAVYVCSLRYPACNANGPYYHLWPVQHHNIISNNLKNSTIFKTKVTEHKMCEFDVILTVHRR